MSSKPTPLEVGTTAPAFTAQVTSGETVSLSDYSGQWLLLYFYPRDSTPGCTNQACNLRDNLDELIEAGIAVLGVSPDSIESHVKFTNKHDLNFPLLADVDKEIITAYGTWGEKMNYGRKFLGLQRTSYLINPDGVIHHVFKRPRTKDHAAEVLSKIPKA